MDIVQSVSWKYLVAHDGAITNSTIQHERIKESVICLQTLQ